MAKKKKPTQVNVMRTIESAIWRQYGKKLEYTDRQNGELYVIPKKGYGLQIRIAGFTVDDLFPDEN